MGWEKSHPFPMLTFYGKEEIDMKTFTLNGNVYQAKEMGFNFVCDLEERGGMSLEDIQKRPMSMIRFYIAFCMDASVEEAGTEIENHMINGGDLTDVATAMNGAMEDSNFFRSLNKGATKKTTTSKTKKAKVVEITEA